MKKRVLLLVLALVCFGSSTFAQLISPLYLRESTVGLEANFPVMVGTNVIFESAQVYAPWASYPLGKDFSAYADFPFAYVRLTDEVKELLGLESQWVVLNPMAGITYRKGQSRWVFGAGMRFPLSQEDNFRTIAGITAYGSTLEILAEITTAQVWVQRYSNPKKRWQFNFNTGFRMLFFTGASEELGFVWRPNLSYHTRLVSVNMEIDSIMLLTESTEYFLAGDRNFSQFSFGFSVKPFKIKPYLQLVRNLDEDVVDIAEWNFRSGLRFGF